MKTFATATILGASFLVWLPGCARKAAPDADVLRQHARVAEEALRQGDYELASAEYYNLVTLAQQKLSRERTAPQSGESARQPKSGESIRRAVELHQSLAAKLEKEGDDELALVEHQSVLSLLQLAMARERENFQLSAAAADAPYREERQAIETWYRAEQESPDFGAEQQDRLRQEYEDRLAALEHKFAGKRGAETEQYRQSQQAVDRRVQELTLALADAEERLAGAYGRSKDEESARRYRVQACQHRAGVYAPRREYEKALAEYRKCLEAAPDDYSTHLGLANTLEMAGQPAEAAEQYRWMVTRSPDDFDSREKLASLLREAGQGAEAVAVYRELVARQQAQLDGLDQDSPAVSAHRDRLAESYRELAQALRAAGDGEAAGRTETQAQELLSGVQGR